jgi:hypothetical protein
LFWKDRHKILNSGNEWLSATVTLIAPCDRAIATTTTAASAETEGAAQRRSELGQYFADRVTDKMDSGCRERRNVGTFFGCRKIKTRAPRTGS